MVLVGHFFFLCSTEVVKQVFASYELNISSSETDERIGTKEYDTENRKDICITRLSCGRCHWEDATRRQQQ